MTIVEGVGWVLVHFVWQGAAIALALAVLLAIAGDAQARVRYALSCGALALMLVATLATAARVATGSAGRVRGWWRRSTWIAATARRRRPSRRHAGRTTSAQDSGTPLHARAGAIADLDAARAAGPRCGDAVAGRRVGDRRAAALDPAARRLVADARAARRRRRAGP